MRVTNSMLVKDMLWNANNNLVSMAKMQTELSTGKKIHRPSDDPVGITQVLKYKTDIRETEQYGKNITDALGWLEVSESSLTNIKDILQRVRELTVQAANGTNTAEDTKKIQTEVAELTKEIIVSGNATSAGRYLFTGLETNKKLFNDDGTYNIDMTSERRDLKHVVGYEVSVGEVMSIGTHPADLFGVVSSNSFFEGKLVRGTDNTTKATQSTLKSTVSLTQGYDTDVLEFGVGGITYSVDTSTLEDTGMNPMTKQRFVDAVKAAVNGTDTLSEVADVYFDTNNQLVIQDKSYGAGIPLTSNYIPGPLKPTGFVETSNASGVNGSNAMISTGNFTDADVIAEKGTHIMTFQFDDVRKNISINFSSLNSVSDLEGAIQNQLNLAFTPINPFTVSMSGVPLTGASLNFSISDINDGNSHQLSVDYIVAQRSVMVTDLQNLMAALNTKDDTMLQTSLGKMDLHLDRVLVTMGEIGGKSNRVEFIKSRVEENEITFTNLLSKVQDVDMAEAIMYFKNLENIYRASLSVGSKVIQPSLVDFIK